LASYDADFTDLFCLAAGYIVRIFNGAKAGDLPIEQANKFELVINLTTAKKLGLSVPCGTLLTSMVAKKCSAVPRQR
jgi:putative tryptophan/tyrosine transport system substrate-binding protein